MYLEMLKVCGFLWLCPLTQANAYICLTNHVFPFILVNCLSCHNSLVFSTAMEMCCSSAPHKMNNLLTEPGMFRMN